MELQPKRMFMKPGKTNKEDRENFIKFWAAYMKSVSDEEWSKQQNVIIDSQLRGTNHELYLVVKSTFDHMPMRQLRSS